MSYVRELRENWRPLLAATIGIGSGLSIHGTITSAIAPSLVADVGWTRAEFTMIGSLGFVNALALPFIGRLADTIGVRMTALIGMITMPLAFLAYSMMNGTIAVYTIIFLVQSVLGMTTTATVYTRLAVQNVSNARGMALAIVASGPALTGAILGPVLNTFVEDHGWRASYQALAVFAALVGVVTFLLIPPDRKPSSDLRQPAGQVRRDYTAIFHAPAFWIMVAAMLLCNLPQVIMLTQLKFILLDNGVSGSGAAIMFTALSIGMLTGRFLTGAALDRFNPYVVSFVTLGLPSIGLFLIASSFDSTTMLLCAVFSLGFAFGAEGDIIAYIVSRQFDLKVYGSVMGLLTASISIATTLGTLLLSFILLRTGGFDLFLIIVGCTVLIGSALLLLLRRYEMVRISDTVDGRGVLA